MLELTAAGAGPQVKGGFRQQARFVGVARGGRQAAGVEFPDGMLLIAGQIGLGGTIGPLGGRKLDAADAPALVGQFTKDQVALETEVLAPDGAGGGDLENAALEGDRLGMGRNGFADDLSPAPLELVKLLALLPLLVLAAAILAQGFENAVEGVDRHFCPGPDYG